MTAAIAISSVSFTQSGVSAARIDGDDRQKQNGKSNRYDDSAQAIELRLPKAKAAEGRLRTGFPDFYQSGSRFSLPKRLLAACRRTVD